MGTFNSNAVPLESQDGIIVVTVRGCVVQLHLLKVNRSTGKPSPTAIYYIYIMWAASTSPNTDWQSYKHILVVNSLGMLFWPKLAATCHFTLTFVQRETFSIIIIGFLM